MGLKENIKSRRSEKGMTLEELANKVGVSRQTIQRYESGIISNIPSDKIELMAKALSTTPAYLMGWEDEEDFQQFKENRRAIMDAYNIQYYENKLLKSFSNLNNDNKKKVIDYSSKLLDLQKFEEDTLPDAAHARTDIEVTEEMKKDDDAFFDED